LPLFVSAQVSKISFTTVEQNIKPNTLSEAITIQTQDSNGDSLQTTETLDLEFLSTSATGEFVNSSGNAATKTMNANTANRTFYYRDPSQGTFTLTVNATGRVSGEQWSVSQKITVSADGESAPVGEVLAANTESSGTQNSQSATSGSATPSYTTSASQLEVLAGSDRATAPGSPISFQATIKKNNVANSAVSFSWSYGDGNVGEGALVSHMYKYPGEYAVVLNARAGNSFAISRFKVRVLDPKISLTDKGDHIEIVNETNGEINLFNWKLVKNGQAFIFQPDTIILPKSKMLIDGSLLTMKGQEESGVVLKNFLGQVVAKSSTMIDQVERTELSNKLQSMKLEATALLSAVKPLPSPKVATMMVSVANQGEVAGESVEYQEMLKEGTSTEPLGEVIYESPVKKNTFQKVVEWMVQIFD
jgi:hypothetical protein